MNNEFYERALQILENLTVEEMEAGLQEFGIECQRKINVFVGEDIDLLSQFGISWPESTNVRFSSPEALASSDFAANDNSYALAA